MIWYSHVNEDNRAERNLLLQGQYDQVICITGSGERALALMDRFGRRHSSIRRSGVAIRIVQAEGQHQQVGPGLFGGFGPRRRVFGDVAPFVKQQG